MTKPLSFTLKCWPYTFPRIFWISEFKREEVGVCVCVCEGKPLSDKRSFSKIPSRRAPLLHYAFKSCHFNLPRGSLGGLFGAFPLPSVARPAPEPRRAAFRLPSLFLSGESVDDGRFLTPGGNGEGSLITELRTRNPDRNWTSTKRAFDLVY